MDRQDLIDRLGLSPHPEGGWYRETWRDEPADGGRGVGSAIYFLLGEGERSHWHRVDAAEVWHHYAGDPSSWPSPTATTTWWSARPRPRRRPGAPGPGPGPGLAGGPHHRRLDARGRHGVTGVRVRRLRPRRSRLDPRRLVDARLVTAAPVADPIRTAARAAPR
ncbi:MAG: cupin domain-containing protein [Acidimicrobiales bacterium]